MTYYRWSGAYGDPGFKGAPGTPERHTKTRGNKGVMRERRAEKRREANERNTRTLPERTRTYRRKLYAEGLLVERRGA